MDAVVFRSTGLSGLNLYKPRKTREVEVEGVWLSAADIKHTKLRIKLYSCTGHNQIWKSQRCSCKMLYSSLTVKITGSRKELNLQRDWTKSSMLSGAETELFQLPKFGFRSGTWHVFPIWQLLVLPRITMGFLLISSQSQMSMLMSAMA